MMRCNSILAGICLLLALISCNKPKKVAIADLRIVMLGDSETRRINHYWGADTNWNTLTGYKHIFNLGFDGYKTTDIIYHEVDTVAPLFQALNKKPHVIFLMVGINDISLSVPLSETLSNIRLMIDTIQKHPIDLVIESVIPTTNYYDTLYGGFPVNGVIAGRVKEMNDSLKRICRFRKIPFLNIQSRMLVSNTYLNSGLSIDGIHLNYKGYVIWKDCLKKYISTHY
ncbi:GDSL-type esterase/lipase family protein [Fluviicola sp.]|uniref:GDSL-type esterase/lipase family protein n=1 Tax=Fluviicola sp. TaxID=1917219 RepID=UPI003D2A9DAB